MTHVNDLHTFRFAADGQLLCVNHTRFLLAKGEAINIAVKSGFKSEPIFIDTDRDRDNGDFPYGPDPIGTMRQWGLLK